MSSMCVQHPSASPLLILYSQTELAMNTHNIIADIRQDVSKIREDSGSQNRAVCDMCTFPVFQSMLTAA